MSVNACGDSCAPCPVPDGAVVAYCDGVECGFVCGTGLHACDGACARDSDPEACGEECQVCPSIEHGSATCSAGNCGVECANGYHLCAGECVADSSVNSCGSACEPCIVPEGGSVDCEAGSCVPSCPDDQVLCAGSCIDPDAACDDECASGTHDCGGLCLPDTSVTGCGADCVSCPLPTGASAASCVDGECAFECGSGYHRCGEACVADDDASACGVECSECPTDAHGTAACSGGTCSLACENGYHLCDETCVSNDDEDHCGPTSCAPCQAPDGGSVSCNGLTCVPACPSNTQLCNGSCIAEAAACDGMCPDGTHNCDGLCLDDDSADSCGLSCTACTQPSNGQATCNGTNCVIECNSGFHDCGIFCMSDTSPDYCGETCTSCPTAPANGARICSNGTCDFSCNMGYHRCGDGCAPDAWAGTEFIHPTYGCGHTRPATMAGGADWIEFVNGLHVDLMTGYGWYQVSGSLARTQASTWCNNHSVSGLSDFVLPTIDQVRTLADGCAPQESGGACPLADPSCLSEACGKDSPCTNCTGGAGPNNGAYCRSNVPLCFGSHTTSTCSDCGGNEWRYNVSNGHFSTNSPSQQVGSLCVIEQVPGY